MATVQELQLLRSQLEELNAQMDEMRQQPTNAAMNAAVTGLPDAVRTMGQSVSRPRPEDMRVGKPEPCAPGRDFDDLDVTFNGYAGTLEPTYPTLLKAAGQSATAVDGDSTTRSAVCNATVLSFDAYIERSADDREESWKQRLRSL